MRRTLRLGKSPVSQPIKGYSHRGFVIGWCAIILVAVAAFALLTLPLDYTSADLESAQAPAAGGSPRA